MERNNLIVGVIGLFLAIMLGGGFTALIDLRVNAGFAKLEPDATVHGNVHVARQGPAKHHHRAVNKWITKDNERIDVGIVQVYFQNQQRMFSDIPIVSVALSGLGRDGGIPDHVQVMVVPDTITVSGFKAQLEVTIGQQPDWFDIAWVATGPR